MQRTAGSGNITEGKGLATGQLKTLLQLFEQFRVYILMHGLALKKGDLLL